MTAQVRNLKRAMTAQYTTQFENLLVSGCSYTYNNSLDHVCSWPYYLRDLAGFDSVLDCSQSGAGNTHVFNSIVNEIETNPMITAHNTLVVVMWSGLTRTDVIATTDVAGTWHPMSNYNFNADYATLSIFNTIQGSGPVDQLCQMYKKIVSVDAQVYESLIRMIALRAYLDQRGFRSVAVNWRDPKPEYQNIGIDTAIIAAAVSTLDCDVEYLESYAVNRALKEPDGHPTPDAYLGWTQQCLIPYLLARGFVSVDH